MRKILALLLLWSGLATAQIGNYPPLIGQKSTIATLPVNCSVGMLYFATDASAGSNVYGCTAANTWTAQGSSAVTIGTTTISGGATTQVLYNLGGVVQSSASHTYSDTLINSGPGLKVGSGTTTSAGLQIGYSGTSGYGAIFPAGVTPSASNYIFASKQDGADVALNSSSAVGLQVGGALKLQALSGGVAGGSSGGLMVLSNTAGQVMTLTGGTATTDVGLLIGTRTNNNAAVATGVKFTFTDTSSAAGFLPLQILGGSGATTNLLSVPKEGGIAVKAKIVSGTAPTLASGGCTNASAVTENGTARFSVAVGTGCSGSQPLVFTLPTATTGWNCYAQNSSNAASLQPAQSSAISTTSVTITAYSRTLGTAAAWNDNDVVVVSCLGG